MTTPEHPRPAHDDDIEAHDLGLSHDLPLLVERQRSSLGRRGLLGVLGGLGAVALVGCATDPTTSSTTSATAAAASDGGLTAGGPPDGGAGTDTGVEVAAGEIPEETAGPYPGDGTNGPNVLTESGVVRSDLTASFGAASGVAAGVPVTVRLKVYDLTGDDVTVLPGAAVYLWHCDREGRYSMYDDEVVEENYLRGVQQADADGWLQFTTIFPGCYAGRWPHLHFEVYESLEAATTASTGSSRLRTSQLAIPEATCREVYGVAEGYDGSVSTFEGVSLDSDGVFSDGYSLQLAEVTGSVDAGYTMTLKVPV